MSRVDEADDVSDEVSGLEALLFEEKPESLTHGSQRADGCHLNIRFPLFSPIEVPLTLRACTTVEYL
jgi:hypothetical protein